MCRATFSWATTTDSTINLISKFRSHRDVPFVASLSKYDSDNRPRCGDGVPEISCYFDDAAMLTQPES